MNRVPKPLRWLAILLVALSLGYVLFIRNRPPVPAPAPTPVNNPTPASETSPAAPAKAVPEGLNADQAISQKVSEVLSQHVAQAPEPPVPATIAPEDLLPKPGLIMNWRGLHSGIHDNRHVVIRTRKAWDVLWREHAPHQPEPPIDFSRYMVIGVFLGTRPNAGHELVIRDIKKLPDQLALEYQELLPKEGQTYAAKPVEPYALKVIPQTDLHIHFQYLRPLDR